MRKSASALTMRAPKSSGRKDWFTFRNSSDDEAEIDIYGDIGGWTFWDDEENVTAAAFRRQLKEFKDKSRITVHINSPGGSVFEGLAIYNALKQHDAEIKVVVDALAASAASFIAMAADPGQLIMARNSIMMIHDASAFAAGDAEDMREMAELLDMHSDNIADIYFQRTGETTEFWRAAMRTETWYTGAEAVTAGLADAILEKDNEEAEKVAASFDLSIYNYAGREKAPSPSVIHKRIKSMMNKAKEAAVTKVVAEVPGNQPAEDAESNPPVAPPPPAGGELAEPGKDEGAEETEGTEIPAGVDGDGQPIPAGNQPPAENKATNAVVSGTIIVNGKSYKVPAEVANRVEVLETAAAEAVAIGRKNFVTALARDKKISGGQIEKLESFVDTLTDVQWNAWSASWDAAPTLSLLEMHGGSGAGSSSMEEMTVKDVEIEKLEAILKHHRRGGMAENQVLKTASYAKLQQLKSTNP